MTEVDLVEDGYLVYGPKGEMVPVSTREDGSQFFVPEYPGIYFSVPALRVRH